MTTGWIIGFALGGAVVVVVVVLLVAIIALARGIAGRAEAILAALEASARNTRGLWALSATNATADRIVNAAALARESLEGGPRR